MRFNKPFALALVVSAGLSRLGSVSAQPLDGGLPAEFAFDDGGAPLSFEQLDGGPANDLEAVAPAITESAAPPEELQRVRAPVPQMDETSVPVDVEVRSRSRAESLRRSALAIGVIDLREAKRATADLGEVLARHEGVAVRRTGGLGSDQRFSLAGLEGEQIRFFLDGIPLDFQGYPFGIANVPVNAIERVEIYRGVVPVALGADALGGAVNLVTKAPRPGLHGAASYQGGSFDTHRATLDVSYLRRGWFARASGFGDFAANDYPITVDVSQGGMPQRARVHRFHDAYRAEGANLTLGVTERSWARRLLLRGFFSDYEKELQHDALMNVPYGEAETGRRSAGVSASYLQSWSDALELEATAGYALGRTRAHDLTLCVYDWFGRCAPSVAARGEIKDRVRNGLPQDARLNQQALFARVNARYASGGHAVRLSLAPTYTFRTGTDRYEPRPGSPDPLDADRRLGALVLGLEYALSAFDERLELSVFGKAYLQWLRSEELLRNNVDSVRRDRSTQRLGGGAAARYALLDALWLKGSYEYATRLPGVEELFGDGVTVDFNLELAPEVSHNANLSLATDTGNPRAGRVAAEATWFMRDADRLIYLTGANVYRYQNLFRARSLGGMATASWSAPRELFYLGGNVTYQAFRNASEQGPAADTKGDRLPNRPYLFANGTAKGQLRGVFSDDDTLSLTYNVRYTHEFFRAWESKGRRDTKDVIPSQLVHSLLLTQVLQRGRDRTFSMSLELQNLTDARVYDFFGVQRPGRAVFAKVIAEL